MLKYLIFYGWKNPMCVCRWRVGVYKLKKCYLFIKQQNHRKNHTGCHSIFFFFFFKAQCFKAFRLMQKYHQGKIIVCPDFWKRLWVKCQSMNLQKFKTKLAIMSKSILPSLLPYFYIFYFYLHSYNLKSICQLTLFL